ncbi:MAG: Crp/Fnr family transcriptional regulator [Clostridia bacterium]|nr:Crp/Fnr family transcriptional regulator [Clostridia bacterium]
MKAIFNVEEFINDISSNCSKVQTKFFQKGEVITTYLVNRKQVCILVSGSADLIRYDFNGNKNIVERFYKNDIFGEIFYRINTNNDLFVRAKEKCEVIFFNYEIFEKKCKSSCKFHEKLLMNLPNLVISKASDMNFRIELLSKRTIRDKLISYFLMQSEINFSKTFTLPFSLTDLADYLSIDRSAMMREIACLKDEGFIKKHDNKITLLVD